MSNFKYFLAAAILVYSIPGSMIAATYPTSDYQEDLPLKSTDHQTAPMTQDQISDQQLSQRIQYAIKNAPKLSETARRINIEVKDARVTLNGAVASSQEKQELENTIKQVKGVRELDNNIQIIP